LKYKYTQGTFFIRNGTKFLLCIYKAIERALYTIIL
jgi:hypothetical protein